METYINAERIADLFDAGSWNFYEENPKRFITLSKSDRERLPAMASILWCEESADAFYLQHALISRGYEAVVAFDGIYDLPFAVFSSYRFEN